MINYSIVMRSVNTNLFEINQAKARIKAAKANGEEPKPEDVALMASQCGTGQNVSSAKFFHPFVYKRFCPSRTWLAKSAVGIGSALDRHLNAEVGGDVVADGGAYAVAHVVEVLMVKGNGHIGRHRLLTIEVALPMLVELVAENGCQTGIAICRACPKHVVEIASHGNGKTWGEGNGILCRDVLGKADTTVGVLAKLGEHRSPKT